MMLIEGLIETLQIFQALSRKIKGVGDLDEEADSVFRVNYGGVTTWKVWEKSTDRPSPYRRTPPKKVGSTMNMKQGMTGPKQGFMCPNCAAAGKKGVAHSLGECRAAGNKCRIPCTLKKSDGKMCGGFHWFAACPFKSRAGRSW